MGREFGVNRCKLLPLEWISNDKIDRTLYSKHYKAAIMEKIKIIIKKKKMNLAVYIKKKNHPTQQLHSWVFIPET